MGRVIVRTPNAFLMDEPLSNLDAKLRVQMRTEVSRLQKRLGHDDRVRDPRPGRGDDPRRPGRRHARRRIHQVGPPEELYNRPANLFVAGFIGSPAMNFLPATVEGDTVSSPLGDLRLPDERRRRLASDGGRERQVIIGIRPEHLEDASLVGDKRDQGAVFQANVDLLESLGSDKYAYFTVKSERAHPRSISRSWPRTPGVSRWRREDGVQVTARLDAASDAKEDQELEFWLDLRRVHVFDPRVGREPHRWIRSRAATRPTVRPKRPPSSGKPSPRARAARPARTEPGPDGAAEEEPAADA